MDIIRNDYVLMLGDCVERMAELPDDSVDSVVTDPPYGIEFMSKGWDKGVPRVEVWEQALRVLKPGGHLLSFAGTRTQHRMCVNIEDAGFEIRDMMAWVFGSGFPKSLNISKAIDKSFGFGASKISDGKTTFGDYEGVWDITKSATLEAQQWDGWGTGLKPAFEPITLARKPIAEKTIAANVLAHGTGGINIDGCRVGNEARTYKGMSLKGSGVETFRDDNWSPKDIEISVEGRFPANFIHDGSPEATEFFPITKSGTHKKGTIHGKKSEIYGMDNPGVESMGHCGNEGSAARFFYCAKASKADREEGLEMLAIQTGAEMVGRVEGSLGIENPRAGAGRTSNGRANIHPTVKPTDLMRYLCRLITPPGGWVLDPFMGSGSTGKAARLEGFNFVGIDLDPEYFNIANRRIEYVK